MSIANRSMTDIGLLEYFAAHAPVPSKKEIEEKRKEILENPRPWIKKSFPTDAQIVAEFRFEHAKAMIDVHERLNTPREF